MGPIRPAWPLVAWLVWLAPAAAFGQVTSPTLSVAASREGLSGLWLAAGGAFATVRGDCTTCEGDYPYRHSGAILADVGYHLNGRANIGVELFWMPVDTESGRLHTVHVNAVGQFRPWARQGFFLKGGAGVAFVRNWVDAIGPDAINSKALSVVIGTGWAFRPSRRLGAEVFATQHAGALGDLQTAGGSVPDVMGNFWSVGAAVVIR